MAKKKRVNRNDLTLRNLGAYKKTIVMVVKRLALLEKRVKKLEQCH